jgi:hypothetical protein
MLRFPVMEMEKSFREDEEGVEESRCFPGEYGLTTDAHGALAAAGGRLGGHCCGCVLGKWWVLSVLVGRESRSSRALGCGGKIELINLKSDRLSWSQKCCKMRVMLSENYQELSSFTGRMQQLIPAGWLDVTPGGQLLAARLRAETVDPQRRTGSGTTRSGHCTCSDWLTWETPPNERQGISHQTFLMTRLSLGRLLLEKMQPKPRAVIGRGLILQPLVGRLPAEVWRLWRSRTVARSPSSGSESFKQGGGACPVSFSGG